MSHQGPALSVAEQSAVHAISQAILNFQLETRRRLVQIALIELERAADCDTPMFARGVVGPLGKLDCDLKTKVDEHTDALFRSHCAMAKSDPSAVLRDCVYALVHKRTYSQMVVEKLIHDAKRTDALQALTGLFQGPEFGGAQHG